MLNRMYTMSSEIHNLVNHSPLVGPACTVKVFPGDNLMVHKALDAAKPGDVVVVDTSGSQRNAVLGDLVTNKARHRGIAGLVNQPCGDGGRESAEDTGRQAIRKRKAGNADIGGHDFSQKNDHRAVVASENHRKPQCGGQQP